MTARRVALGLELVDVLDELQLDGDRTLTATLDPDEAAAGLPAVLIVPPEVDFTAHEPIVTWSLVALTSSTAGGVAAWEELDDVLDRVEDLLPVERGVAGVYALTPDTPAVPCYTLTLVTQGSIT